MEFDNHDSMTEYKVDSRVHGELWLLLVVFVVLSFVWQTLFPVKAEPVRLTPHLVQEMGMCKGVKP